MQTNFDPFVIMETEDLKKKPPPFDLGDVPVPLVTESLSTGIAPLKPHEECNPDCHTFISFSARFADESSYQMWRRYLCQHFMEMKEKRLWSAKATGRKCTKLSTENESPYTDFLHHNDNVLRIPTDSRFKQAVTLSSPSRTNRIPIVCINLGYKWSFKITDHFVGGEKSYHKPKVLNGKQSSPLKAANKSYTTTTASGKNFVYLQLWMIGIIQNMVIWSAMTMIQHNIIKSSQVMGTKVSLSWE